MLPKGDTALALPYMMRDSFKYPSDKVADLVDWSSDYTLTIQ
jgi:hypothetical protein